MAVSYAHGEIPASFQQLAKALDMPATASWSLYRDSFIKRWGRQPGQERWQMAPLDLPDQQRREVYQALDALGVIGAWQPPKASYDYAILPGAIVPTMQARLAWLIHLWQQGVRFRQLVVLSGQRPLTSEIDKVATVFPVLQQALKKDANTPEMVLPMHETEAARLLLQVTPLPKGMQDIPVVFVDTPRIWQQDHWQRAHTGSTVEAWMELTPKPGSTLLISSQPSAHYQDAVFKNLLPEGFTVDTSTEALATNARLEVVLDGVATWLRSCTLPPKLGQ